MAEVVIALALFVAEITGGSHVHIPGWMLVVNSNLIYLPMLEVLFGFSVCGLVMLKEAP